MLNEREYLILKTVIEAYCKTGEPVGSKIVALLGPLKLSSASIRNIMSSLEEKGYLTHVHTSSGRVPTDLAYRYYVNNLVSSGVSSAKVSSSVQEFLTFDSLNISAMLEEFTRRLCQVTNYIGLVMTSNGDAIRINKVELILINRKSILGVLVTNNGLVQNVIITVDNFDDINELVKLSNFINSHIDASTLMDIYNERHDEIHSFSADSLNIFTKLILAEKELLSGNIYLDGTYNFLDIPNFIDTDILKSLLKTVEEKKRLDKILKECMSNSGVKIFVGDEFGVVSNELGLIVQSYSYKGAASGIIGIIGPKNMPYEQIIPVINCSTKIVEKLIDELIGG